MIACAARTGSTMLVRTLRSHPDLIVHGEVWGDHMVGVDGPLGVRCGEDQDAWDALQDLRFRAPAHALDMFLDPHQAQSVGFKLKFDELVRPEWAGLRRLVEDDAGIAIVFLHRRVPMQSMDTRDRKKQSELNFSYYNMFRLKKQTVFGECI